MLYTTNNQKLDAHAVMRGQFLDLAANMGTPDQQDGDASEMMKVLTTYAEQFVCSTAMAYSRIKWNVTTGLTQ